MSTKETLYLGSSAMGIGAGDILWWAPDGATGQCSAQGAGIGLITGRAQEVLGPAPLYSGGYTPCTLTAGSGQTGLVLRQLSARRPAAAPDHRRRRQLDQSAAVSAVAA
ncbi:MAG: hypothetical protein R2851_04150 [Caldilineaceae bacterium]